MEHWTPWFEGHLELGPHAAQISCGPAAPEFRLGVAIRTLGDCGPRGALMSFIFCDIASGLPVQGGHAAEFRASGINLSDNPEIGFFRYLPTSMRHTEIEFTVRLPRHVRCTGLAFQTFGASKGRVTLLTVATSADPEDRYPAALAATYPPGDT